MKCSQFPRPTTLRLAGSSRRWRYLYRSEAAPPEEKIRRIENQRKTRTVVTRVVMESDDKGKNLSITTPKQQERLHKTSMGVYEDLKKNMLKNTILSGCFFVFYLSSTVSLKAGLASGIGSCGSYLYLLWLIRDVDQLSNEDQIPIKRVQHMEGLQKRLFGFVAHYQQALQSRMLIPVALAVFAMFLDRFVEGGLSRIDQGCILLGFLSYKIPLALVLYDALKPRLGENDSRSTKRFSLEESDDAMLQTDLYGRTKPQVDEKLKSLKG